MEKKNNLDPQYNNLLEDILENGVEKTTRNGNTLSVFGRQIRHKMSDGFPYILLLDFLLLCFLRMILICFQIGIVSCQNYLPFLF